MVQEIRRFIWCDVCAADAPTDTTPTEPAETYAVTINDTAREIDLCEVHHKTLVEPLVMALASYGHKPERPAVTRVQSRPGRPANGALDQPCLWCDQAYASVGSLAGHLVSAHGFPKVQGHGADIQGMFGKLGCPYCDDTTVKASTGASFGMHIFRRHNHGHARTMAGAYRQAMTMGDPVGKVAKVLALVGPDGQYVGPPARRRRGKAGGSDG